MEQTESSHSAVDPNGAGNTATDSTQQTHRNDEVDLTLIRWMLSLSPLERLRTAQRYARSAQRLRNAPRRIRF
ncbi:MAG: hypothetical protein JWL77_3086 [Chthonomonadaceae bacterium]|nr:hypothetical protein [Chthonomonadaceae bacterium]